MCRVELLFAIVTLLFIVVNVLLDDVKLLFGAVALLLIDVKLLFGTVALLLIDVKLLFGAVVLLPITVAADLWLSPCAFFAGTGEDVPIGLKQKVTDVHPSLHILCLVMPNLLALNLISGFRHLSPFRRDADLRQHDVCFSLR